MAKTMREIKESLRLIDGVCEMIDARLPESGRNSGLGDILGGKPRIVLLNKSDLADPAATAKKIRELNAEGFTALAVDCRSGKGLDKFLPAVRKTLGEKIRSNAEKGMAGRPLRIMVVGIPNVGKSSFINRMAGKNRAKVADKPGVTLKNQWYSIGGGVEILDTPGVLAPKLDDPETGFKLAFIGSVKDEIPGVQEVAVKFLQIVQKKYPDRLARKYKISDFEALDPRELLELIGAKRGALAKGGEIDSERAAAALLDEYRKGGLGKLTFD